MKSEMSSKASKASIVGLTGGIGSGKSAVSARLAQFGACIIDTDLIAREVVGLGTIGLDSVIKRFGNTMLAGNGSLDRAMLASIVFKDPFALRDLNSMLHPLIEAEVLRQIEVCLENDAPLVVVVVPLLFDTGAKERYGISKVIVVDLPLDLAVQRVAGSRKMSEEEVWSRIASQISREERILLADFVIDNSLNISALDEQVKRVWSDLQSKSQ